MPGSNGTQENFATAVTEVSERVTVLIREEVELAKAEVTQKVSSLARGTVAVLLGAVFGVFALIFLLETAAWGFNALLIDGAGDLWIGFAIVFGVLALLTIIVFLFAWRKLRVGPPTPQMAIDEAKRIKETVATTTQDGA
ncbi:MAG TPA: phage holin family protein [Solirubrobacteraceae bacterium]|nr:phage holin family protein [Solirubrobacteraceae bacterium]